MEKQLSEKLVLKILGNEYKVELPNNGQLIDIEAMKISMSQGQMNNLLFGASKSAELAYFTVSMIATFTVLIPTLIEDLNKSSLLDCGLVETKALRKAYTDVYYPWFNEWEKVINEDVEEVPEPKKIKEDEHVGEIQD